MKDLVVDLEDRPHSLAAFAEALGAAGVNVEGICGVYVGSEGVDHVLVEDERAAYAALTDAGFAVTAERDVLVVPIEDRPGALGEIARRVADADVDIDLVYLASGPRLVLGVDDLDRARTALDMP
jgi:hypothetical protein